MNYINVKLLTPFKTGNSRFDSKLTPEPRPIQQRNFPPRNAGNMREGEALNTSSHTANSPICQIHVIPL